MRQRKAPDHDEVNDNVICKEFAADMKLNTPKYENESLVEYRYNSDESSWLPAVVIDNSFHNTHGHCIYKIFSTQYGYREVHESVLYPMS
jgi:hypothetical protein